MDEMAKISACVIELKKLIKAIEGELSEQEDSGLLEFSKNVDNFFSWLENEGAIELNKDTQEYEVTAQIPFKVLWILYMNGNWWLNLKEGIKEGCKYG